MKLLLATDGAPDATAALVAATRTFRTEDVQADLLCVVPRMYALEVADPKGRQIVDGAKNDYEVRMGHEAERIMAVALETLAGEGLDARPRTDFGSPGDVILRWSSSYDVTVVGAHDRFGRTQPGVGPVGSQVISRCPSSILVGRESAAGAPGRVLLCVDGSVAATEALRQMVARVRLEDVEVTVMHVVELPWLRLGLDLDWQPTDSVDDGALLDELTRRGAETVVEAAALELERHGVRSRTLIREGLPEVQILSEADVGEYDLIVLGATGNSDLTEVTTGSVAIRVAEYAPATVWVVR